MSKVCAVKENAATCDQPCLDLIETKLTRVPWYWVLQVWFPTDKNMVGCDSCDFWIHDHCDELAAKALKMNNPDIPYHCPPCRHKKQASSLLRALHEAQENLRLAQPRRPRAAYNIFAAEIHKCAPCSTPVD